MTVTDNSQRRRHVGRFLAVVVAYLAIVQGLVLALGSGGAGGHGLSSVDAVVRNVVAPVGIGVAFLMVVAAVLGDWQRIFVDDRPLRRWTLAIPLVLLVLALVVTNYEGLRELGLAFTLLLFVGTMMVGFGEELLFRGVGVHAFRSAGFSEFQVGLWTSLLFGLAHGTNIFTAGPSALLQVVLTCGTGFVFYLVMRATGSLVAAMAAHGLWDFSVLSTQVQPDDATAMSYVAAAVLGAILLVVLVLRRRLAPAQ